VCVNVWVDVIVVYAVDKSLLYCWLLWMHET